jgi:tetraacyldisaccharide-1-P 4'-kinase
MVFRDHHHFTQRDIARMRAEMKTSGAEIVLTTEKDAVRLEACDLGDLPVASVPLAATIEPPASFRDWLYERL